MNAGERLPGSPEPMLSWRTPDGLKLAADAWGDTSAPLVLLMHGGGQTRHAWRATGRNLGDAGYRAVAFDLRGHGDSDWSAEGDYSQDAYVRDIESVLKSLGKRDPILIGASLGAANGLVAVGEARVNAAALIMVDFVPRTEKAGFDRLQTFMRSNVEGFQSLEDVAETISKFRGSAVKPVNTSGLAKVVRRGADGRYHWHWDARQLEWRVQEFPRRHVRLSAAARSLRIPTLLVRGDSSDVVSEEGAREFLEMCPHAEYINLANAGHMVVGDRNDRFGLVAAPFLARVTSGPAAGE